jgi:hypothetical protein
VGRKHSQSDGKREFEGWVWGMQNPWKWKNPIMVMIKD